MAQTKKLSDADYRRLLEFRIAIRRFLNYSKDQARSQGLTPAQHQLLLAVRGHRSRQNPTIGQIAECLLIKHHSAVELVDRAQEVGLVKRHNDADDHRVVRVGLTRSGATKLERISAANLREMARLGPEFQDAWRLIEHLPGKTLR